MREVFRIIAQMRTEGISVLLVEQNVRMSLEISDHAYVLENGQIVYSGPAAELRADEDAYPGAGRRIGRGMEAGGPAASMTPILHSSRDAAELLSCRGLRSWPAVSSSPPPLHAP